MTTYFDMPTQVKFWDVETERYICGIAYRDEIICGECGGIISIDELYEDVPDGIEAIEIFDSWVDFNEYIG